MCSPTGRRSRQGLLERGPGSQTLIDWRVDVLLVHIVRQWLTSHDDAGASWLRGLRDPEVAATITLMHEQPASTTRSVAGRTFSYVALAPWSTGSGNVPFQPRDTACSPLPRVIRSPPAAPVRPASLSP
ncbi:hypothetical protein [Streptomyces sp. NBC_01244]|uniref:hypothetical protein n=1 Tax=Streptomyces sp. NBC_01244 TaxID=2903797 RepID=UPI002E1236A9|nr:hypothetical protein OG247_34315 [Streptomyces sp. NBC_01244]